eukprot:jgi/Undpi1/13336/HiC_scaffold_8.g02995.m1
MERPSGQFQRLAKPKFDPDNPNAVLGEVAVPGLRQGCRSGLRPFAPWEGSPRGGIGSCFACGRVGGRDGIAGGWRHAGNVSYWAALGEWAAQVDRDWGFDRDLSEFSLQYGEFICSRRACVDGFYKKYRTEASKNEMSSRQDGLTGQLHQLSGDAVGKVMNANGFHVSTNYVNSSLKADFRMDAASDGFGDVFMEEPIRPDWIVTSPPYNNVLIILKQACV